MPRLLSFITAGFCGLFCVCNLICQNLLLAEEPTKGVPPPKNAEGELIVGPVLSARSLLGSSVKNKTGESYGKVEEVSLDIGSGTVPAVYIRPTTALDAKQTSILIPLALLSWSQPEGPVTVGQFPDQPLVPPTEDANSKSRLLLLSKSPEITVSDEHAKPLGQITDFALANQKGVIAYAVLELSSSVENSQGVKERIMYAVPLSAFVVEKDPLSWTLKMPKKQIAATPSFTAKKWPGTVDGTWSEYVLGRYGRTLLGGVQAEKQQPEKNK